MERETSNAFYLANPDLGCSLVAWPRDSVASRKLFHLTMNIIFIDRHSHSNDTSSPVTRGWHTQKSISCVVPRTWSVRGRDEIHCIPRSGSRSSHLERIYPLWQVAHLRGWVRVPRDTVPRCRRKLRFEFPGQMRLVSTRVLPALHDKDAGRLFRSICNGYFVTLFVALRQKRRRRILQDGEASFLLLKHH